MTLLKISLVFLLLASGTAKGSIVEVLFSGEITRNYVYEEVYGVTNGPYVPAEFENETTFNGILRYDDQAPIYSSSSSIGNIYETAEIELTIGDNYTVTDTGYIFVKNDYASAFDLMTFTFQDFPVNFINPADEMTYQNNFLRLEFYDDDLSIFDTDERLPTAGSIDQFDRLNLRELSIVAERDPFIIDCPACVEGETWVYPRQEKQS